jgi:S1-C subfamily serine protease
VLGGKETISIKVLSRDGKQQYEATIVARDATKDIAVLDIGFIPPHGLEASTLNVKRLTPVTVLGFPNHNIGDTGFVSAGHVTGFRRDPSSEEILILISSIIITGNSGGPVLDSTGKVIGLAVRGATSQKRAQETEFHAVMPISVFGDLMREKRRTD